MPKKIEPLVTCGIVLAIALVSGCDGTPSPPASVPTPVVTPAPWLGIPSMVNHIIVYLHDGTGWLLNKSEVSVKKSGEVRTDESGQSVADFQIAVKFGGESFETTAQDVPCDRDGIPSEASIERLRSAIEEIKTKMKRLQN